MAEAVRKRAVEETADRIREDILTGVYLVGEHLPAERELATTLGVSRLTLRSALTRLEAEGLVRAVHGAGNLVMDYRAHGGVAVLGHLAGLAMQGRGVPLTVLGEMLELRRAIAAEALGLATERGTDAELRALRAHVMRQHALIGEPRAYMQADLDFARGIVRATHNVAFELVFNTVQRAIAENPALELAYYANAAQTLSVYERLLDLMDKREGDRVRRLGRRLLDRLDRRMLALVS